MKITFLALFFATLSVLVVGFIWHHTKVFGSIWMRDSGLTEKKIKGANMPLLFGLSLFYAFLISMVLQMLVIHQWGDVRMVGGDITSAKPFFHRIHSRLCDTFRTFKHEAFNGLIMAVFLPYYW